MAAAEGGLLALLHCGTALLLYNISQLVPYLSYLTCPILLPVSQGASKLRLQLMPLNAATAHQVMTAAGLHPFLELTLSSNKSLLSVLRHLGAKWQAAAARAAEAGEAAAPLFVHPPSDCPITLRGIAWGGPECDSQIKVCATRVAALGQGACSSGFRRVASPVFR